MLADKMNQLFLTHKRNDYSFLKKKKLQVTLTYTKSPLLGLLTGAQLTPFFKKKLKKIGTQFVYEIT